MPADGEVLPAPGRLCAPYRIVLFDAAYNLKILHDSIANARAAAVQAGYPPEHIKFKPSSEEDYANLIAYYMTNPSPHLAKCLSLYNDLLKEYS